MSTWFMTVGYPGGDFAMKCDSSRALAEAADKIRAAMYIAVDVFPPLDITADNPRRSVVGTLIRPCPPDLAAWLDAPVAVPRRVHASGGWHRHRAPGGWVWHNSKDERSVFIPVAGAAGITVLEGCSQ